MRIWRSRSGLFVLCIFVLAVHANEEQEFPDEQVGGEKEVFVPITFRTPHLSASPHFFDYFSKGSKIGATWIKSSAMKEGAEVEVAKYDGEWSIESPKEVSVENDYGLIVKTKARHHAIAAKLDKMFIFEDDKPLVVQYEVQFEEGQECGGGYLKLLSEGAEKDLAGFQDKTPYTIMFGPDKCGSGGKVHLIFKYKNPKNGSIDEYHAKQPDNIGTSIWDDHKTHLFTLTVHSSGAYDVKVDQSTLYYGNMLQNLNPALAPPKMIPDSTDLKPEDWDDRVQIEDESAVKPDDWDEAQPKTIIDTSAEKPSDWLEDEEPLIPDPDAARPSDWDDDMDGEWEAPLVENPKCKGKSGCGAFKQPTIPNPLYKGKWRRPLIANPNYKGVWNARLIENPNYFEPNPFAGLAPITAIGIELWTMSQQIIFDNVLVTDSEALAHEVALQTYTIRKAEDRRLAESKGESGGILSSFISATEERPWLWAIFALCLLLPLIGIAMCCFGNKSNAKISSDAYRKKTDAIVPDDDEEEEQEKEVPQLVEDEPVEDIEVEQRPTKPATPPSPKKEDKKQTMADLEEDELESIPTPSSPKKSPASSTVNKRKVRRQD